MAGTLRVLRDEEIGCVAGGSMTGAGDAYYVPPQSEYYFQGIPTYYVNSDYTHTYAPLTDVIARVDAWQADQASYDAYYWSYYYGTTPPPSATGSIGDDNAIIVTAPAPNTYYDAGLYELYSALNATDASQWYNYQAQGDIIPAGTIDWVTNNEIDRFKEYLDNNGINRQGYEFIEGNVAGLTIIVMFNGQGTGAVYTYHNPWVGHISFQHFGAIENVQIGLSGTSGSGSLNAAGGSLNSSSTGWSITWDWDRD